MRPISSEKLAFLLASGDLGYHGAVLPSREFCRDANFHCRPIDRLVLIPRGPAVKFHLDATLRFWVDCSYEDKKHESANRPRLELIAEILREYERCGDAMRYLNAKGQIAWKASPGMLQKLADAEREVEDDMEDRL